MVLMITKQQRMFFCEKTLIYNYQSAMIGFLAILYLWKGERLRSEEKTSSLKRSQAGKSLRKCINW